LENGVFLKRIEINNRTKIAFFIPSLNGGGAERVILNLVNELVNQDVDVHLVLVKADGPYMHQLDKRVRVVNLNKKRVLFALPALVRYLKYEKPYSLLSAMDHANIIALAARMFANVKTRVHISVHTNLTQSLLEKRDVASRVLVYLIRKLYKRADSIVAVSKGGADDISNVARVPKNRVCVIYNPVLTTKLYELLDEPFNHEWFDEKSVKTILSVGRLSKEKNFSMLIKAFSIVASKLSCRLIILGEGEERERLESMVQELKLADKVLLPGFVENPFVYMKHCSVFVLSSILEGFGNVLVEAMAASVPIISTDCPTGPKEILSDKGVLVPIGDYDAMAREIEKVLTTDNTLNYPVDRLACFDMKVIIKQYMSLLCD
jgi:glycosyltransferase involved in cell wall biosynthesis